MLYPLAVLATYRGLVAGVTAGAAVATVILALALPRRYVATARFVPARTSSTLPGNLAGLAGQFGFSLNLAEAEHSPQFYVALLEDRSILERVLATKISVGADSVTVLDALGVENDNAAERVESGVRKLDKITDARVDLRTSIVTVTVTSRAPVAAAAIANRFLEELEAFNLQRRESAAAATRRFLETRLAEAQADLRGAEETLRAFLERNRRVDDSPQLQFQQQRHEREVDLRTRLVASLEQEYEQARIREVNTTPLFSVIRRASPPVRPSKPQRKRLALLGSIVGLLVGTLAAFVAHYVRDARAHDDPDYLTLRAALAGARKFAK